MELLAEQKDNYVPEECMLDPKLVKTIPTTHTPRQQSTGPTPMETKTSGTHILADNEEAINNNGTKRARVETVNDDEYEEETVHDDDDDADDDNNSKKSSTTAAAGAAAAANAKAEAKAIKAAGLKTTGLDTSSNKNMTSLMAAVAKEAAAAAGAKQS